jgi:predicted nucleic acid-binding Zn ribbon protein
MKCAKCGAEMERLLSAPAIQFKGSGWYVTDYAPKAASEKTTPDGAAAATSDKKEDKSPGSAQTPPPKSSPEK